MLQENMILKITSVLASGRRRIQARCRRRIQARCKHLLKVTITFIRRGTVGRKEREKHFLFPRQEVGANTQNGDP
jgi:hypothetical protein